MNASFRKTLVLLSVLFISFFISCASSEKKVTFKPIITQSRQYVDEGKFQKAIDSYKEAYEKYPDQPEILDNYIRTIEEIHQSGHKALDAANFALAEKIFSVLLKNYPNFQSLDKSLSLNKETLNIELRKSRIFMTESQARKHLAAESYEKAIDSFKARYQEYPDDSYLLARFISILERMNHLAQDALSKENFAFAGKVYYALSKNYKDFEKFQKSLSFSNISLDEELKNCRLQLTRKGLEQYRKGNLAEAIAIWKSLLEFDPDNQEIKKAIDTANVQLKKLKKKKEKSQIEWTPDLKEL